MQVKCDICGGEDILEIKTKIRKVVTDEIKVFKCNTCGVNFLYPYFDDETIAGYYNGEYRKEYSHKEYYLEEKNKYFFNRALPEAKKRRERVKNTCLKMTRC